MKDEGADKPPDGLEFAANPVTLIGMLAFAPDPVFVAGIPGLPNTYGLGTVGSSKIGGLGSGCTGATGGGEKKLVIVFPYATINSFTLAEAVSQYN